MTKKKKNNSRQNWSIIGWEVLLILVVTLITQGLFFENQVIPFAVVVSFLILLILLYKSLTKKLEIHLPIISLFFFAVAISYIPLIILLKG